MNLSIDIKGQDDLVKEFQKFGKDGKKMASEITEIKAREIEAEAKRLAPVDTGKLQQSIKAERFARFTWLITAFETYAPFIEFGTTKTRAQPFLFPAFRQVSKQYLKDLKKGFERLTKKFNR